MTNHRADSFDQFTKNIVKAVMAENERIAGEACLSRCPVCDETVIKAGPTMQIVQGGFVFFVHTNCWKYGQTSQAR